MRVVLTGGGGFIGSHLAELLLADGHEVVVIDRQPDHPVDGCRLIRRDVADTASTSEALRGVDAVCHLAARVGLGLDYSDAPGYVADNDLATSVLLAALAATGFTGRLVLSSSMVVYGEGAYRCPTHGPVRPGPRPEQDLAAGRFEVTCPGCGTALEWATVDESARSAVLIVLVAAAAMRVAAATGTTPSISNDLYRYGWDAHVQASGIDPYRYPPAAPQLQSLRVPPFFPTGPGCAHIGKPPGCTTLNRSADRTIYPPVAQLWFDLVAAVAPGRDVREWQLAAAAVDLAVVGLLMVALRRLGRDPTQAAWYALSPIPVIEFAGNGHVDGLALLLLVAALLALQRGRRAMAGLLIGLAAMVKLYPGVAVIACWRRGRWRMAVTAAAVGVVSYLPHVLVVGTRVVGYLPGYLKEEHYGSGSRFLLLGVLPLPSRAVTAVGVLFFAAVAVMVVRRGLEPAAGLAVIIAAQVLARRRAVGPDYQPASRLRRWR